MRSSGDAAHGSRRIDYILVFVLLLVLAARIGLTFLVYARPELAIANDSDRYIPIANAILKGTAYSWTTDHPGELLNTVGYPLFLAGVFATLGTEPGDVALAQLLLSGLLAMGLYLLLAGTTGALAAFAGALLLALDPLSALWSMTVLTETLFATTLGLAAGFLVVWSQDQKLSLLLSSGICAGLSCLVKPFALLVAAVWAVGIVLFAGGNAQERMTMLTARIRRAALFLLPIILLVGPWIVRNGLLWNCPTLSSVDRVTLRDYMAAKVIAEADQIDLDEAQRELQAVDPGVCPEQTGKYWGIILANPVIYARLHAAGTVPVLIATNFDRWLQFFGEDYVLPDLWRPFLDGGLRELGEVMIAQAMASPGAMALMVALTAFQVGLYVLALMGAVACVRRADSRYKWIVIMLVTAIAILVLTPGQGGHERFRVPVQPMLAILISYGIAARRGAKTLGRPATASTPAG